MEYIEPVGFNTLSNHELISALQTAKEKPNTLSFTLRGREGKEKTADGKLDDLGQVLACC